MAFSIVALRPTGSIGHFAHTRDDADAHYARFCDLFPECEIRLCGSHGEILVSAGPARRRVRWDD